MPLGVQCQARRQGDGAHNRMVLLNVRGSREELESRITLKQERTQSQLKKMHKHTFLFVHVRSLAVPTSPWPKPSPRAKVQVLSTQRPYVATVSVAKKNEDCHPLHIFSVKPDLTAIGDTRPVVTISVSTPTP